MSNERLFTSLTLSQSALLRLNLENYLEGSQIIWRGPGSLPGRVMGLGVGGEGPFKAIPDSPITFGLRKILV